MPTDEFDYIKGKFQDAVENLISDGSLRDRLGKAYEKLYAFKENEVPVTAKTKMIDLQDMMTKVKIRSGYHIADTIKAMDSDELQVAAQLIFSIFVDFERAKATP